VYIAAEGKRQGRQQRKEATMKKDGGVIEMPDLVGHDGH